MFIFVVHLQTELALSTVLSLFLGESHEVPSGERDHDLHDVNWGPGVRLGGAHLHQS